MWFVILSILVGLGLAAATWCGRRLEHWGATRDEIEMSLVGDDWLDGPRRPRLQMTRAASVDAPLEHVWPWIAQMARGAGYYSYDRLDNIGRRSARHIVSWIPAPAFGDASAIGSLRHLVPGRELAWWIKGGRFFGGIEMRGAMLYRVTAGESGSRLLVRMHFEASGLLARPLLWALRTGDGIMTRRQILNVKARAERYGMRADDPVRPETGARDQYQRHQAIYASGEVVGTPGRSDAEPWRTET